MGGVDPSWRSSMSMRWPGVTMSFAGPDAASLGLIGWRVEGSPGDAGPLRLGGRPLLEDDLATWQTVYGDRVELLPTAGTEDPPVIADLAVHLADGDIRVRITQQAGSAPVQMVWAGASCDPGGV